MQFDRQRGAAPVDPTPAPTRYNTLTRTTGNLWNGSDNPNEDSDDEQVEDKELLHPTSKCLQTLRLTDTTLRQKTGKSRSAPSSQRKKHHQRKRRKPDKYDYLYNAPVKVPATHAFLTKSQRPKPAPVAEGPGYNESGLMTRTFGNYTASRTGGAVKGGKSEVYEHLVLERRSKHAGEETLRVPAGKVDLNSMPKFVRKTARQEGDQLVITIPADAASDPHAGLLTTEGVKSRRDAFSHKALAVARQRVSVGTSTRRGLHSACGGARHSAT